MKKILLLPLLFSSIAFSEPHCLVPYGHLDNDVDAIKSLYIQNGAQMGDAALGVELLEMSNLSLGFTIGQKFELRRTRFSLGAEVTAFNQRITRSSNIDAFLSFGGAYSMYEEPQAQVFDSFDGMIGFGLKWTISDHYYLKGSYSSMLSASGSTAEANAKEVLGVTLGLILH